MPAHATTAAVALLLVALALPSPCSAATPGSGFATSRAYLAALRGLDGGTLVAGPPTARLIGDPGSSPQTIAMPIAELRNLLASCRAGAAGYGAADAHPGRDGSFMHFECAEAASPPQTLKLVIVTSVDGRSVDAVDAHMGTPMAWLPPAPGAGSGQPAYPDDRLPAYREISARFIDMLRANPALPELRAVTIKVSDLRTRSIAEVPPARAAEILRNCSIDQGHVAAFSVRDEVPPHDAVRFLLKCDSASSADADLNVWVSIADGSVDGLGIQNTNDYRIPAPSATARQGSDDGPESGEHSASGQP